METMTTTAATIKLQFGSLQLNESVIARLAELDYTPEELQAAIESHKSELDGAPSVYVGTYHKYACGSICGLWVDLTTFADFEEFETFCKAIHADEADPELMCQDAQDFPREYYNECMDEDDFDKIKEYAELCEEHSAEAVNDYLEYWDDLRNFEDNYCGRYDSEEDYARELIDECYNLEKMMGSLSDYFDYERFARDLFAYDYHMGSNGHVFRAC